MMASNTADLNVVTFNIHGINRNWVYLQDLTLYNDISFVQEHWLLSGELSLLQQINKDFVVFAQSSMNVLCNNGLLLGRPFGGVAVFIRKELNHIIKYCASDQDGSVIYVKLANPSCGVNLLIFGCYFPCNNHSSKYVDDLSQVLGCIDSVALCNPGFRLCIVGDLNFECTLINIGYSVFNEFGKDYCLISCNDLVSSDIEYTYHHTHRVTHRARSHWCISVTL